MPIMIAPRIEITIRQAPSTVAVKTVISPAATGLFFFVGWFRSCSRSNTSLKAYTPLDARQNTAKAEIPRISDGACKSSPAKMRGASTKPFLTHWWGLRSLKKGESISSLVLLGFRVPGSGFRVKRQISNIKRSALTCLGFRVPGSEVNFKHQTSNFKPLFIPDFQISFRYLLPHPSRLFQAIR